MALALRMPFLAIGLVVKALMLVCAFRVGRRLVALCVVALLGFAGYQVWLRDSSLVAVREVKVVGVDSSSGNRQRIANALSQVARGMTTLHVRPGELVEAAQPFATVKSLRAESHFPNKMTIVVTEHEPIALARIAGRPVAIAGDGSVLEGMRTRGLKVPQLTLDRPPVRGVLTGKALDQALVLGAAPSSLRPHLISTATGVYGVTVRLRDGGELRFGEAARLEAKWGAASRVLADPERGHYAYIDVRIPERPALGGLAAVAIEQGLDDGAAADGSGTASTASPTATDEAGNPPAEPQGQTLNQESRVTEPSTSAGETSVAGGVAPG